MANRPNERFFEDLPEVTEFDEVVRRDRYHPVPLDWHVIVTDVRGSTRAIEEGRYREVNALGVASIIAVKNATPDIELPYVFGGDGATLLVPETRLTAVECALRGTRQVAETTFDLGLRIACVPVAELVELGHAVRVQRYRLSPHVALAMFAGTGFQVAEQWVKHPETGKCYAIAEGPAEADFEGFQCRWQPMQSQRGEIISLIVVALGDDDDFKETTYRNVLEMLETVLGERGAVPVSRPSLRSMSLTSDYSVEARLRSQEKAGVTYNAAVAEARKRTLIGRALMAFGARAGGFDGRTYKDEFIENTDFRKFDETLRMVLDLRPDESQRLEQWLDVQHRRGHLTYGLHRSNAALATCMVKAYEGDHVHFVDGAGGGYALAAKSLKARLATASRKPDR